MALAFYQADKKMGLKKKKSPHFKVNSVTHKTFLLDQLSTDIKAKKKKKSHLFQSEWLSILSLYHSFSLKQKIFLVHLLFAGLYKVSYWLKVTQ